MAKLKTLTDDDIRVLRDLLERERKQVQNTRGRTLVPEKPAQAPEVYVAFVPSSITGRTGLSVFSVSCPIYRQTDGTLSPAGFERDIYNLSFDAIPSGRLVQATRDKFGTWWATDTPDSLEPDAAQTGTGTYSTSGIPPPCDPVTFSESEVRCEPNPSTTGTTAADYRLVRYSRTITIDIVNGCLTRSVGDWYQSGVIGCCDPSCVEDPVDQKFWYCLSDPDPADLEPPGTGSQQVVDCGGNVVPSTLNVSLRQIASSDPNLTGDCVTDPPVFTTVQRANDHEGNPIWTIGGVDDGDFGLMYDVMSTDWLVFLSGPGGATQAFSNLQCGPPFKVDVIDLQFNPASNLFKACEPGGGTVNILFSED